jgi:hypothetical protein
VIVLKRLYNFLLLNPFCFYNNVYLNPFFEAIPKSSGRQMRSEYCEREFPNRVFLHAIIQCVVRKKAVQSKQLVELGGY